VPKWPKLSKEDIQAVAPVNGDGRPDTFNYLPTRFITKDEAEARGWKHFYLGDVCTYGHKAPRFVSNPNHCVDCNRLRKGRLTIGGKGESVHGRRKPPRAPKSPVAGGPAVMPQPPEPDALEKRFLKAYAELKDFDTAAKEVGKQPGDFKARLSYSKVFRDAVELLEVQCGLSRTPAITDDFEWTDEKRVIVQRTYVNTGNLSAAIASVGATNWDYETEIQENEEFAETMQATELVALRMLDRAAVSSAIGGDSRLMPRVLAAKIPEYGERVNVNMKVEGNLTDDQLNQRLVLAFEQLGSRVLPAKRIEHREFTDVESGGALEAPADDGNEDSPQESEQNLDLL
jgi:hypothetical protein